MRSDKVANFRKALLLGIIAGGWPLQQQLAVANPNPKWKESWEVGDDPKGGKIKSPTDAWSTSPAYKFGNQGVKGEAISFSGTVETSDGSSWLDVDEHIYGKEDNQVSHPFYDQFGGFGWEFDVNGVKTWSTAGSYTPTSTSDVKALLKIRDSEWSIGFHDIDTDEVGLWTTATLNPHEVTVKIFATHLDLDMANQGDFNALVPGITANGEPGLDYKNVHPLLWNCITGASHSKMALAQMGAHNPPLGQAEQAMSYTMCMCHRPLVTLRPLTPQI